jgi:hypothetical protein
MIVRLGVIVGAYSDSERVIWYKLVGRSVGAKASPIRRLPKPIICSLYSQGVVYELEVDDSGFPAVRCVGFVPLVPRPSFLSLIGERSSLGSSGGDESVTVYVGYDLGLGFELNRSQLERPLGSSGGSCMLEQCRICKVKMPSSLSVGSSDCESLTLKMRGF